MKYWILIATLPVIFFSACKRVVPCKQGIHLLPEYGHKEKCTEQLSVDTAFLNSCERKFHDTILASQYYSAKGWQDVGDKKYDRAMKRFNQVWLLNKNSEDCYWGFGALLMLKNDIANSIPYFEKALRITNERPELCIDAANALFRYSFEKQDVNYISRSIDLYKRSIALGYYEPRVYTQLSRAFMYMSLKDSANRYYAIASKVSPETIPDDLRRAIDDLK